MIPHRIRISEESTSRLRFLKSRTGLTPNILSRFAFVLSSRDVRRVSRGSVELNGQEFNSPTLFGEHQIVYELLLLHYIATTGDDRDANVIIANHIENGLHKMGHIRSITDITNLE